MIKINLATRRKQAFGSVSAAAGAEEGSAGLSIAALAQRFGGFGALKASGLENTGNPNAARSFLILVLGAGIGYYAVDGYKQTELQKLDEQLTAAHQRQDVLTQKLTEARKYGELKTALESDEATMRGKIQTIQSLMADRTSPPRMLTALASAIPKEVWLNNLELKDSALTLKGSSADFNRLSEFLKNLNESVFFKDTALTSTQGFRDPSGADIAAFELVAKRR